MFGGEPFNGTEERLNNLITLSETQIGQTAEVIVLLREMVDLLSKLTNTPQPVLRSGKGR